MQRIRVPGVYGALGILLLMLVLVGPLYAQEPKPERDGPAAQGLGGQGLADPPLPGYRVLYMFTGARDAQPSATYATSVHCTNYGQSSATVRVELFDYDGDAFGVSATIDKNETCTISSRGTAMYAEDATFTLTDDLNQGSGRVLSTSSSVVCTVQVVDAVNSPPQFVARLPLYNAAGQLIDVNWRSGYVPVVIRQ